MDRKISEKSVLIISIFIAGLCSIIYELLISTTSSYFMGDSIRQFSLTIGIYMAAMGLGSYFSKFFQKDLLFRFIEVEILLGFIGGLSVPLLYFFFANVGYAAFQLIMILLILIIGILTGFEVPLLMRIMKKYYPLKVNLSNVLSLDYLGALVATLLFPFVLLPFVGVFLSSVVFGMVNLGIGFFNLWYFSSFIKSARRKTFYYVAAGLITLSFILMMVFSSQLLYHWHDSLFRDRIVYSKTTPYQTMVVTKAGEDVRLYIDRIIQFSSVDEYRYHESLVHPAMELAATKKKVLILGGGEGLAVREVLKHDDIGQVTVVDIDPTMFEISKTNPHLTAINEESLQDKRVITKTEDAMLFLQYATDQYDVIIADLPDPSNHSLARLYSRAFFKLVKRCLHPDGVFVTQASGVYHTNKAYWCIANSIEAAGFDFLYPYHAYVPSFGDWGFIMAANQSLDVSQIQLSTENKFLDQATLQKSFHFEKDLLEQEVAVNTLDHPVLLDYYLVDWRKWSRDNAYVKN